MRRSRIARVLSEASRKKFGPNAISIVTTRVVAVADEVPETEIVNIPPTASTPFVATVIRRSFAGDVPLQAGLLARS